MTHYGSSLSLSESFRPPYPLLLPPATTIADAHASNAVLPATLASLGAGAAVLLPAMIWPHYLFQREPVDPVPTDRAATYPSLPDRPATHPDSVLVQRDPWHGGDAGHFNPVRAARAATRSPKLLDCAADQSTTETGQRLRKRSHARFG